MGTHPSGPAMLASDPSISLQDWLEQHPQALGAVILKRFGLKLPFLFKVWKHSRQKSDVKSCPTAPTLPVPELLWLQVLSVETALSIQSHPDKKLAERLHAQQPHVSSLKQACFLSSLSMIAHPAQAANQWHQAGFPCL